MATTQHFHLVRITIGNASSCPGGEREQYQLRNGFYTTGTKIPKTIWGNKPTHAIVYHASNFSETQPWLVGTFKGIYEIGDKIEISSQEEWDKLYPEGWWDRSKHSQWYQSWTWDGGYQCGYYLNQLTDANLPEIKKDVGIRGDMASVRKPSYIDSIRQRINAIQMTEKYY